jgi:gamma-tubulin complex component 2
VSLRALTDAQLPLHCSAWTLAPAAAAAAVPAAGALTRALTLAARPAPGPLPAADAAVAVSIAAGSAAPAALLGPGPGAVSALTAAGALPPPASAAGGGAGAASVLASLPPPQQEAVLCDDLLSALAGLPSRFVVATLTDAVDSADPADAGAREAGLRDAGMSVPPALAWHPAVAAAAATRLDLSPSAAAALSPAAAEAVSRVLPLCRDVAFVSVLVAAAAAGRPAGAGRVWAAVCAAAGRWLQAHALLIARLEAALRAPAGLTLLQLWHATRPAAARWARVRALLTAALARGRRGRGAHLLTLLQRLHAGAGDAAAREDYSALWAAGAGPYMRLAAAWALRGDLSGDAGTQEFHVVAAADWGGDRVAMDLGEAYWRSGYVHRAPAAADSGADAYAAVGAGEGWPSLTDGHGLGTGGDDGDDDDNGPLSEVPLFLRPMAGPLLLAGRHWGVVRTFARLSSSSPSAAVAGGAEATETDAAAADADGADPFALVPAGAYASPSASASASAAAAAAAALSALARSPRAALEQPQLLAAAVGAAHEAAAGAALSLLRDRARLDLPGRLRSARGFFLLGYGDLSSRFLDLAGPELALPAAAVSAARLDALWEDAVRTTAAARDPYRDAVACYLQPQAQTQAQQGGGRTGDADTDASAATAAAASSSSSSLSSSSLRGLDVLALSLRASWPLNLVFSRRSVTKYQLLFRHLVFLRHVQRQLGAAFVSLQTFKAAALERSLAAANTLRHRMLGLVSALATHLADSVLEPAWRAMLARVEAADTVEAVVRAHAAFLDGALHACMLTSPRLLTVLVKVLTYCLLFADNARRLSASVDASHGEDLLTAAVAQPDGGGGGGGADAGADATAAAAGGGGSGGGGSGGVLDGRARASRAAGRTARAAAVVGHPHFALMISRFSASFDERLRALVAMLAAETEATAVTADGAAHAQTGAHGAARTGNWSDLLTRLDYNNFYSGYFANGAGSAAAAAPAH